MPYLIRKTGPGDTYKVEVHGKYLSKKGLPLERAKKQRIAVILSEKRHSGGFKYVTTQGRHVDRPLTPYQKQFFSRGIGGGLHIRDKKQKQKQGIPLAQGTPHTPSPKRPRTRRILLEMSTPEMQHSSPAISRQSTPQQQYFSTPPRTPFRSPQRSNNGTPRTPFGYNRTPNGGYETDYDSPSPQRPSPTTSQKMRIFWEGTPPGQKRGKK